MKLSDAKHTAAVVSGDTDEDDTNMKPELVVMAAVGVILLIALALLVAYYATK